MNPLLASIYGQTKTASEAAAGLDLNEISGAELLAGLENGTISLDGGEKVASGDDLDLSQVSGAELLEILAEMEGSEKVASEQALLEKMASDGSLDYFDMAGRVMAHSYADEMAKVAGADEININLDEISGEDLVALMNEGYEFVETEKVAGRMASIGEAITDRVGGLSRRRGAAGSEAAKTMREQAFKKMRAKNPGMGASEAKSWGDGTSYNAQVRAKRMAENKFNRRVGQGATGAAVGAGVVGAGGVAAMLKKRSEKK